MKKKLLTFIMPILMMLLMPNKINAADTPSLNNLQSHVSGLESRVALSEGFQREHSFFLTIANTVCLMCVGGILIVFLVTKKNTQYLQLHEKELHTQAKYLNYMETSIIQWNQLAVRELATIMEKFITFTESEKKELIKDHTIVLELSRHIVNIENNLSKMNAEDGGVKRISRAIQKIHDSFKTHDYELTPLLGAELRDGQIIEIDQRELDLSIPPGKLIVSNVIKAEILYKGEQIQRAKVDVKFNY